MGRDRRSVTHPGLCRPAWAAADADAEGDRPRPAFPLLAASSHKGSKSESVEGDRILVIKLGALGDIVQVMGAAAAIRAHHAGAHVTFLTTAPFADLARQAPYFDEVWIDTRPDWRNIAELMRFRQRLRQGGFSRVYDFQTRRRTRLYFELLRPGRRPEWSGIAPGASHPHANPGRNGLHTLDRQEDQLRAAGLATPVPLPDLSWAARNVAHFGLPTEYLLMIPGGSAHRPEKRWPAPSFAALARQALAAGLAPVLIGGPAEREIAASIAEAVPGLRDLTGCTDFGEIIGLARAARRTVGNDTGPMHLAVAAGSPATVLYSAASDPALTAPRGVDVVILRRTSLADLSVDEVAATLRLR